MQEGAHYESEYFLTLTYLPPLEVEERMKGWMFEGSVARNANRTMEQILDRFHEPGGRLENVFGQLFQTERLKRLVVTDDFGFSQVHDRLLRSAALCEWRRSSVRTAGDSVLLERPSGLRGLLRRDRTAHWAEAYVRCRD